MSRLIKSEIVTRFSSEGIRLGSAKSVLLRAPGAQHKASRMRKREVLLFILLIALGIRALYFRDFSQTIYAYAPNLDAAAYDEAGEALALGTHPQTRPYYQDPLYPKILATFYKLFGHHYCAVYLIQNLSGLLLCFVIYQLARQLFESHPGKETISTLSLLLAAVCTPFIYYENLLLKTSLGTFFSTAHLCAYFYLLGRFDTTRVFPALCGFCALGMLLGLNLLNRGNYIVLTPLFLLGLLLVPLARSDSNKRSPGSGKIILRKCALATVAYLFGAGLVVAPITYENYRLSDEFILITSQGGQNFYLGNNPWTRGSYVEFDWLRANPAHEEADFLNRARSDLNRELSPKEVSRYFYSLGLNWIIRNPSDAILLYLRKTALWLSGSEQSDNYNFQYFAKEVSPILSLPISSGYTLGILGWSGILLFLLRFPPLAIACTSDGAANSPTGQRPKITVRNLHIVQQANAYVSILFVAIYSLSVLVFFVFSRYRIPIYPLLIAFGAYLVFSVVESIDRARKRRSYSDFVTCLALTAVVAPLVYNQHYLKTYNDRDYSASNFHRGNLLSSHSQASEALKYYRKSVAAPNPDANVVLGVAKQYLYVYDDYSRAAQLFTSVVARFRNDPLFWRDYALALENSGDHRASRKALRIAAMLDAER